MNVCATKAGKILLLVLMSLLLSTAVVSADVMEKKGKFRVDGYTLVLNEKENIYLDKNTAILSAAGRRLDISRLNHARILLIETDARGVATKVIMKGGWY